MGSELKEDDLCFIFLPAHPFSLNTNVFVLTSTGGKTKPNMKLDHEVEILFELGV